MNPFDLHGKVAVVTGATGLLGKEHCIALCDAGASVVVADLDGAACEKVARGLSDSALGVVLDVTQRASIEAGLRTIVSRFGKVDVLVNNAAVNDMFENPALA